MPVVLYFDLFFFFFSWIRLVFPYLCPLHAVFCDWNVVLRPFSTSKSYPARNVYSSIRLFLFLSLYLSQCTCACSVVSDSLRTPATRPPPMDCSPPGSFVHGILQARIPKWVVICFSRGSSQPRDWMRVLPLPQWQVFAESQTPLSTHTYIEKDKGRGTKKAWCCCIHF